jgi:hypothetical protein
LRDFSVRNGDKTIIDDLTRKNNPAPHDTIDRVHSSHSRIASSDKEDVPHSRSAHQPACAYRRTSFRTFSARMQGAALALAG